MMARVLRRAIYKYIYVCELLAVCHWVQGERGYPQPTFVRVADASEGEESVLFEN